MTGYATPDPTSVPAVDTLLQRLGLGALREGAVSPGGRSDNWLGTTTSGRRVFVKRVVRAPQGPDGFTRSLAHDRAGLPGAAPALLGADPDSGVLVFDALEAVEPGVELALDGRFTPAMSAAVGAELALLHGATVPAGILDEEPSTMPPLDWFAAVPWPAVRTMNGAQLEAWRILQGDVGLHVPVQELRRLERDAPAVPIHGDLRLDQVLAGDDDTVHLCDWECLRLGDAARDVGAWIGEWIYHSVFRTFSAEHATDWSGGAEPLDHDDVLRRGNDALSHNAVHVAAFWRAYAQVRPIDAGLRHRSFLFAGWHVIDRFLAASEAQTSLHPVAKAAAGIGRAVLTEPATVASLLDPAEQEVTA